MTAGNASGGPGRRILEALACAAVRAWARTTVPRARGVRVKGLLGGVPVRFDEHGVPHVRAGTEADAFSAMGVCHALDRYFQMDMMRRVFAGRLCEVVGERPLRDRGLPPLSDGTTLDVDRLMRVLDLVPAARRALKAAAPGERRLLDAYVEGVNAGVRALSRRTPIEHRLLRLPLEPWTAVDTCVVGKGMALGLSFKWRTAPVMAAVAAALNAAPAHLAAILPRGPGRDERGVARVKAQATGLARALSFLGWDARVAGSNAFLVGAARSASGKPLLASDPHLELSLPPIWYLASVVGGRYAAVGATMPGVPAVLIGRTQSVAWGVTNGMIDDGDLWQEEVDGNGTRYKVDGAWRDLEVETQEIRRRGAAPHVFRLRRTHRGPLLSDAFPGAAGSALSLRLTLHDTTHDLQTFLLLGRARTGADVEAAALEHGSPAQNLLWATVEGEAGYRLMGRVPTRPAGEPALPRDGTTTAGDWTGAVPAGDLPGFRCGEDAAVVSANDPPVSGDYPHYLSNLFEPPWRAAGIRRRLEGRRGLCADDLAEIQMDVTSLGSDAFRRAVILPHAEAVRAARPPLAAAVDRLLGTGPVETVDAVGPALQHLVYHHLARRTFGPRLGEPLCLRWLGCTNLVDAALLRAFTDPASPWAEPAVRPTLLGQAIDDAVKDLAARGLALDARWGALHRLTLRHPLSAAPVIGGAFTRGPFEMAGGPFTPSAGQYRHDLPADMYAGASYRQVVDLARIEDARMITFGGQSGHPGSPHYDDLTPLWREGKFIPMRLAKGPPTVTRVVRLHPG